MLVITEIITLIFDDKIPTIYSTTELYNILIDNVKEV